MSDQAAFNKAVAAWLVKNEIDIRLATKRIAFELLGRIATYTPRDTGRASASWMLAAGTSANLEVEPEGKYDEDHASNKAEGVVAANAYVISNNLPYIVALEEGHSRQRPSGFVRLAVADVRTNMAVQMGL